MTLEEIENVDKQLLAIRYDANSLSEDYFQIADLNLEETLAAMVKHVMPSNSSSTDLGWMYGHESFQKEKALKKSK